MSITITIPGVGRWDGAASTVRALAPLVAAALLPVLEEVVPGWAWPSPSPGWPA